MDYLGLRGCVLYHTVISFLIASALNGNPDEVQEFCRWENLNATCGPDHVILMTSAKYGRMRVGRCLTQDVQIGCHGDVLAHADERCSGRHDCVIRVPDETLHEVQPCSKDFMAYLEASYTCLPVATGEGKSCKSYESVPLTEPEGYIGNVITESTGYGTSYCPWKIRLSPGQKINISLLDFGVLRYNKESPICQVYATINEKTKNRDVTVCGGSRRGKPVLVTDTNEAIVTIVNHGDKPDKPYFLLKYTAVGCPDMKAPSGGWVKRDGDSVSVGCDNSEQKYHLVCRGNDWVGTYKNCTQDDSGWNFTNASADDFPFGLLISVAIGVVLGILLGSLMLSLVLMYRRKKRQERVAKGGAQGAAPHVYGEEGLYGPTFGKNFTSVGYDKGGSGGYSHIWELRQNVPNQGADVTDEQRRASSKLRQHGGDVTAYPGGAEFQQSRPMGIGRTKNRDHVYESPKPARREEEDPYSTGFPGDIPFNTGNPLHAGEFPYRQGHPGDIPYYHEFDPSNPSNADHVVDPARKHEISRVRHGSTDCQLSLHDD